MDAHPSVTSLQRHLQWEKENETVYLTLNICPPLSVAERLIIVHEACVVARRTGLATMQPYSEWWAAPCPRRDVKNRLRLVFVNCQRPDWLASGLGGCCPFHASRARLDDPQDRNCITNSRNNAGVNRAEVLTIGIQGPYLAGPGPNSRLSRCTGTLQGGPPYEE
jgi:hypothetical protein